MNGVDVPMKTYRREWTTFLLAGSIAISAFYIHSFVQITPSRVPFQRHHINTDTQIDNWFFMLKLPEVTKDLPEASLSQERFNTWLVTLLKKGYHPMLLSDVLTRLNQGRALPPRAVVFCFDPGYRQTYDVYAPILARYGTPALWTTDE